MIQKLESVMAKQQVILVGRMDATRDRRTSMEWLDMNRGEQFKNRAYEQEQETQADQIAIGYLYDAGYPPEALPQLLRAMHAIHGKEKPEDGAYTSSHPSLKTRIEALDAEVSALKERIRRQEEFQ